MEVSGQPHVWSHYNADTVKTGTIWLLQKLVPVNKMGSASVQWHNILLLMLLLFWAIMPCGLVVRYQHFGNNTVSIFSGEVRLL